LSGLSGLSGHSSERGGLSGFHAVGLG
jgi:hypothetical protein